MKVTLSEEAEESLAWIIRDNDAIGKKIFAQLKNRLPYDPYPDDAGEFESMGVKSLEREGIDIRRLKSRDFFRYRIFYLVDEDDALIYILEIVKRGKDTYSRKAPHIETIRRLYMNYYLNKGNRIK